VCRAEVIYMDIGYGMMIYLLEDAAAAICQTTRAIARSTSGEIADPGSNLRASIP